MTATTSPPLLRRRHDVPLVRGTTLATSWRWSTDAHGFLDRCARTHGEVFRLNLLVPGETMFFASPEASRTVFTLPPTRVDAGVTTGAVLKPVFGETGIMILDGDEHLRQRRLTGPALLGDQMRGHIEAVTSETRRAAEAWPVGEPFPVIDSLERVTFRILLRAVLGIDDAVRLSQFERTFVDMARNTAHRPVFSLLMWTTPSWDRYSPSFRRCRATLDGLVLGEIKRCRAHDGEPAEDVLSRLVAARDADGSELSDREIRDKVVEMLLTGYVTTATTVAWLLERALRTPREMERLEAAVDNDDRAYVDAAIQETLRLRAPVPQAFRRTSEQVEIDGVEVQSGELIAICIYLLHMREDAFPNPRAFEPARFLGAERQGRGYVHVPFGGGARRCIGAAFALMEVRHIVSEILSTVRLRAAEPTDERPKRVGPVFQPGRGGRVIVTERRP